MSQTVKRRFREVEGDEAGLPPIDAGERAGIDRALAGFDEQIMGIVRHKTMDVGGKVAEIRTLLKARADAEASLLAAAQKSKGPDAKPDAGEPTAEAYRNMGHVEFVRRIIGREPKPVAGRIRPTSLHIARVVGLTEGRRA